jgi:N-acetylmuramate 1-kinase
MAAMTPSPHAPLFLALNGWEGAEIRGLAGDASFRRYFRVVKDGVSAVLMDAPPEHEDVEPFVRVATHLLERGFAPPRILARDVERGLLLLEDFGDERVAPLLAREPQREREIYEIAIDVLAALARDPAPRDLDPYDAPAMAREVALLTEWYAPAMGVTADEDEYQRAWASVWDGVLDVVNRRPVLVLRDYHADNLMVLPDSRRLGLLDFQDALAGHPAYDLVSLLQDARRDVSPELEEVMLDRYVAAAGVEDVDAFRAHYQILARSGIPRSSGSSPASGSATVRFTTCSFNPASGPASNATSSIQRLRRCGTGSTDICLPEKRAAAWQTDRAA